MYLVGGWDRLGYPEFLQGAGQCYALVSTRRVQRQTERGCRLLYFIISASLLGVIPSFGEQSRRGDVPGSVLRALTRPARAETKYFGSSKKLEDDRRGGPTSFKSI